MIKVTISNKITINGLNEEEEKIIKKGLTIKNPAYERLVRITGSRFTAQAYFKYFTSHNTGYLIIPRGARPRLISYLKYTGKEFEVKDLYVEEYLKEPLKLQGEFRAHQVKLINQAVEYREGVIKAGTGSGKTLVGAGIVANLGLTATIIVPNTVLLNQFYEEFKNFYNIKIGRIGDGNMEKDAEIIVTTWQSLNSDEKLLEEIVKKTSILIVDEVQGCVSKERMKVLQVFRPKYLYGLTATPFRSNDDGRTEAIHFLCGPVIAEFNETLMTPKVKVVRTGIDLPFFGNYHELVDEMVKNDNRNNLIKGLIVGEVLDGRKVMVLTKRIEHYKILQTKLPDNDNFIYIDSSDKDRNKLLLELREGKRDFAALFGTVSLLSAGTDIPQVETIIFASDIKSSVLTTQMAGRVLRLFSDKKEPKIIDLFDDKSNILRRQYYERRKVYRDNKWEIEE